MTKKEFLSKLDSGLTGLPRADIEERLEFFSEMIDDSMEEGLTEQEAVERIGTVESVISQILEDTPLSKLVKEKIKPKRRLATWEIVLLAAGSPLWLVLAAAALIIVLSVYIVIWSVIVSFWSVFVSLAGCAAGFLVCAPILMSTGNVMHGTLLISGALVLAGLSIFAFFGCRAATRGAVWLSKQIILGIKSLFVGKEKAR